MSFFDRFRSVAKIHRRDIDPDALEVLNRLTKRGYTAYLVGGGVRDLLLGRTPKDFDIATNARPNQIRKLFSNAFVIGRRFKLTLVCFGPKQIETATFRRDPEGDENADSGLYQERDNTFGTPEQDAYRRDFTANALFWDPKTESIVDYTGGLADLKKRVLRCIGDPNIRFREDPVRMLRAVRLSSRLDFSIHSDSAQAITRHAKSISDASRPRLFDEILRLFTFSKSEEAMRRLWKMGLMEQLLPAISGYVERTGGEKSPLWKYLASLDEVSSGFDTEHRDSTRYIQENAIRLSVLLAPLFREVWQASGEENAGAAGNLAREMVSDLVVVPFATPGWRVPRALCYDLADILTSLVVLRQGVKPRRMHDLVKKPWFYTAFTCWQIVRCATQDKSMDAEIARWRKAFLEYEAAPHPARVGTYQPQNPDRVSKTGFEGDVPEDRDALFPAGRKHRRRRPSRGERRRKREEKEAASVAVSVSPAGASPEAAPGKAPKVLPRPASAETWIPEPSDYHSSSWSDPNENV